MKTLIAVIAIVTMIGLIATACGSPTTPQVGSFGTPVPSGPTAPTETPDADSREAQGQTPTPVPRAQTSTPVPQARTGGSTPPPVDKEAPVEGARIVLSGGDSPTANLVVSVGLPNDCYKIYQYDLLSFYPALYPWPTALIRYSPKGGGGECSEGPVIAEASKALEGKGHLYEPCKTYQVEINGKRFPALATDGAVECPPASTQPASQDFLALTDVRDVRLNHPTTEPAPLLMADYLLTRSCIRPGRHDVERDGDRLKVYVVVTDVDVVAPRDPRDQCRPIQREYNTLQQEYSIPLEGVTPGQVLRVWVNGIERTLRVPDPGQVTKPTVIEVPPQEGRAIALPPPPPFEVQCTLTKKGPLPIVAVIGEDRIPTGFDAINTGSCKFSEPVTAVRLRLWYGVSDRSDNQTAQIEFDEPLLQLSFPLPEHVPVPTIDADLPQGPYMLEVWGIGPHGDAVEIYGFKTVSLVSDRPRLEATHDWDVESYAQPADHHDQPQWTTTHPGELARQLANSGPTLLYYADQPFEGKIVSVKVFGTGEDDGLFGFAVGFQPGDTTNESADYLLLDWKKTDQSYDFPDPSVSSGGLSMQGIALSRVRGVPDADEFWQHRNLDGTPSHSGLEEIQRGVGDASSGWRVDRVYKFTLELTPSNFRVSLNGKLVIDAPTPRDYTSGRLAYYTFSQANISFWEPAEARP